MILVSDKNTQKTYYFPKEKNSGDAVTLKLFSHLSKSEFSFDVSGSTTLDLYYALSPDFSGVYDGEYDYSIYDANGIVLQNGLLRIGEYDAGDIIYDFKEEYVIYNPETGESEIIEYGDCTDAVNEAYRSGYESGFTDGYESGCSGTYEDAYNAGLQAGFNSGWTNGLESGYTVGYNEGWTDGYSSGYTDGSSGGTGGWESGYTSGYTDGYSSGWTDGYESGSTSGSTGGTFLIMSAETYTLSAEDDELTWTWSANTEWKLTIETPWGGGETYLNAGSGSPVYAIGQNDTYSARTFTYIGENADSEVTLTFTQSASAYTPTPSSGWTGKPFRVQMLENGEVGSEWQGYPKYKINGGETQSLYNGITGLSAGDVVEFFVEADTTMTYQYRAISSTGRHNVYGNIMSLNYVDFESATTIPETVGNYHFANLFLNDTNLINAGNLILPATTLRSGCYRWMFYGCSNLLTAPELPASTLVYQCYEKMFYGCSNINYIKCLAETFNNNPITDWVNGVSATGTFVKKAGVEWASGNSGIPNGWDIESE